VKQQQRFSDCSAVRQPQAFVWQGKGCVGSTGTAAGTGRWLQTMPARTAGAIAGSRSTRLNDRRKRCIAVSIQLGMPSPFRLIPAAPL
jgi:hypothetical protein